MAGGVRSEERTASDVVKLIRHEELAVRTIRVTFAAAVSRVEGQRDMRADRLRELVEGWRGWALTALQGHAEAVDAARLTPADGTAPPELAAALRRFEDELSDAERIVGR